MPSPALILLVLLLFLLSLSLQSSTMGNCLAHQQIQHSPPPSANDQIFITQKNMPIDAPFHLPSPLPIWPTGGGFANETIDLGGGLQVRQILSFTKVWAALEGGPDDLGATFFDPSPIPAVDGFFMLGSYAQPNKNSLFGWVLVAKDATPGGGALKPPLDYSLVWNSSSSGIKTDGDVGYLWEPKPPAGYSAVGLVVTASPQKPPLDRVRCVRSDLTDVAETDAFIWGQGAAINVSSSRPKNRGTRAQGVPVGTFVATAGSNLANSSIASCLKNTNPNNFSSMPNLDQIHALFQAYSPFVYMHPKEEFLPSSVPWFFNNGALLYTRGQESSPVRIDPTGANLPQGGSNDDAYWLDLPVDGASKETVKKGDIQSFEAYVHAKPMMGATVTDLAVWLFYPFNGAGTLKIESFDIPLENIGQHVGDWEHLTLRISNFNGQLQSIYFAQHSKGVRVPAPELKFESENKAAAFSSYHGHASYPQTGEFLVGSKLKIGIENRTDESSLVVDTGVKYTVVAADHLGAAVVPPPPWLNYMREWGPIISYDIDEEVRKVEKALPKWIRDEFEQIVKKLPPELLQEEGPTGPKGKGNWDGDEFV
ncbi:hypothetical protein At1g04090-like [Malania oleifera]|uniref:hypothetical protein At1g04090-like n=1 Tax=Malania oleifera TaxID=397392 RepID=UPI0025AE8ACD|nr:hypothetical protein At1g04090-like [Malania oleifera]